MFEPTPLGDPEAHWVSSSQGLTQGVRAAQVRPGWELTSPIDRRRAVQAMAPAREMSTPFLCRSL